MGRPEMCAEVPRLTTHPDNRNVCPRRHPVLTTLLPSANPPLAPSPNIRVAILVQMRADVAQPPKGSTTSLPGAGTDTKHEDFFKGRIRNDAGRCTTDTKAILPGDREHPRGGLVLGRPRLNPRFCGPLARGRAALEPVCRAVATDRPPHGALPQTAAPRAGVTKNCGVAATKPNCTNHQRPT